MQTETRGALEYVADPHSPFLPLRMREYQRYGFGIRLPKRFVKEPDTSIWPFDDLRLRTAVSRAEPQFWNADAGLITIMGSFNPGPHIGIVDLSFLGHVQFAEVMSSKVDYSREFVSLVQEIARYHNLLIHSIDGVSSVPHSQQISEKDSWFALYLQLSTIMRGTILKDAVETILANPGHHITQEISWVKLHKTFPLPPYMPAISRGVRQLGLRRRGPLSAIMSGGTPSALPYKVTRETMDTLENRFAKAVLQDLVHAIEQLQLVARSLKKTVLMFELDAWRGTLSSWLHAPLWQQVGDLLYVPTNSQQLIKNEGYRQLLSIYEQLLLAIEKPWGMPDLDTEGLLGPIRPVFKLYEYWCLLTVLEQLHVMFDDPHTTPILEGSVIQSVSGGFRIPYGLLSEYQISGGMQLRLYYNKEFSNGRDPTTRSYSVTLQPDISIEVTRAGKSSWIHLDAKYSVRTDVQQDMLEQAQVRDFQNHDIYKMHTYLDAICGTEGAYILYPGEDNAPVLFGKRESAVIPGVGAISLRPKSSDGRHLLRNFLQQVIAELAKTMGSENEPGGPD